MHGGDLRERSVNRTSYVAVIGTGSMGMEHLKVLREIPGVEPVAIPIRPGRLEELREAGYLAVRDISETGRVGATLCIIATDTGRHVEDGLVAVKAGLDLLVEKPLSTDAPKGKRLCVVAREANRKLFVGNVLRFSESLNTFRNCLAQIGRIHSVRVECQSFLPDWRPARSYQDSYSARAEEGGVLRDLIHEIDYAGWLFGWPTAIHAKVRNLGRLGIPADEIVELMWETPDDCIVSVNLDYLSRPSRRRMRAQGERGNLEWDGIDGTVTLALAGASLEVFCSSQVYDEMFLAQDRAFIEASFGVVDSRLATVEDGIKALAICDASRRASASRREETVEYL